MVIKNVPYSYFGRVPLEFRDRLLGGFFVPTIYGGPSRINPVLFGLVPCVLASVRLLSL